MRQLYKGIPKENLQGQIEAHFLHHQQTMKVNGFHFHISRLAKSSGYRYKLQNNDLGLVILFGSFYQKLELSGSHLKIEVSPYLIKSKSINALTGFLRKFSFFFLDSATPSGVAVHLACDFQGWQAPADFVEKFVTRCRSFRDYFGMDRGEFNLSEAASRYGRGESFTFGKADALQTCIYQKHLEAAKRDKIDYWAEVWGDSYDADSPVWRVEVRFHHSVLADLARSQGFECKELSDFYPYISDIWAYALNNNRSELHRNVIAPVWQLLRDDAPPKQDSIIRLKRVKKAAADSVGRNVANILGNLISVYAREKKSVKMLFNAVQRLHVWQVIKSYYFSKGLTESDIFYKLSESYQNRLLIGSAA